LRSDPNFVARVSSGKYPAFRASLAGANQTGQGALALIISDFKRFLQFQVIISVRRNDPQFGLRTMAGFIGIKSFVP
jgi:hypothetical protein